MSMGANAATKGKRIIDNVTSLIALEWLTACQAFDFRKEWSLTVDVKGYYDALRADVSFLEQDRYLHDDMQKACLLLQKRLN